MLEYALYLRTWDSFLLDRYSAPTDRYYTAIDVSNENCILRRIENTCHRLHCIAQTAPEWCCSALCSLFMLFIHWRHNFFFTVSVNSTNITVHSELNPTRCNNCVYSSQWLYSTCFGWQFHPSSGVHMLYMASGRQVYCKLIKSVITIIFNTTANMQSQVLSY